MDRNPLIASFRSTTMFNWNYTPQGVVIIDPSKQFDESRSNAPIITSDFPHERFASLIDGEHQDLDLFIRMFFQFIGVETADAPLPPEDASCEHERYVVPSKDANCLIPVFHFDSDGLPTTQYLHSVAARLMMRGNMAASGPKGICIFNSQKSAPWRLREHEFADGRFLSLAQQCGLSVCSTADMLLTVDAARRYDWPNEEMRTAVFSSGRTLDGPPGAKLVGAVNKFYDARKALSVTLHEGADIRKGDRVVVRLKKGYHQQFVISLAHNKEQVDTLTGPLNAGIGADLDRSEIFEDKRGRVFVFSRPTHTPDASAPPQPATEEPSPSEMKPE